jgi:tetratricopeptide (TPR) repeat protein
MPVTAFAQGIKLDVSQGELVFKETWYWNYLESNQTIVEVKSTVPLTFASTTDAGITQMDDKKPEEAGYYFYELIFPTTTSKKDYSGRILSIKSEGFETVKYKLQLESKKIVALLVMRQADALFNARDYAAAQIEYEKEANLNPNNNYLRNRTILCKDNVTVQKADAFYNAENFADALSEYNKISSFFNKDYVNDRIVRCNDAILLKEADQLMDAKRYEIARDKLNRIKNKTEDIKAKIQLCTDKLNPGKDDYELRLEKALGYYIDGNYEAALSLYTDLHELSPNDKGIEQQIASCNNKLYEQRLKLADKLANESKYVDAINEYEKLLKERPNDRYVEKKIEKYKKQVVEEKRKKEREKNNPLRFFFGYMYNAPYQPIGFMVGGCKQFGFYVSGKFDPIEKPKDKSLSYSDFELSDEVKHSRWSVSAGPMVHLSEHLYFFAGAGYGSYCDKYEITNYVNINDSGNESTCYYYDRYRQALDIECGLIISYRPVYVSVGYNTLLLNKPIHGISIGIGFFFGDGGKDSKSSSNSTRGSSSSTPSYGTNYRGGNNSSSSSLPYPSGSMSSAPSRSASSTGRSSSSGTRKK